MIFDKLFNWFTNSKLASPETEPPDFLRDSLPSVSYFDISQFIDIPTYPIVIYLGCEGDDVIRDKSFNIKAIEDALGCSYHYLPAIKNTSSLHSLSSAITYCFPQWNQMNEQISEVLNQIDYNLFYDAVYSAYKLEKPNAPAMLLLRPDKEPMLYPIDISQPVEEAFFRIIRNINGVFWNDTQEAVRSRGNDISYYNPRSNYRESEEESTVPEYDAEEHFPEEAKLISEEVGLQIRLLFENGHNKAILEIYNTLITHTKIHRPELITKVNKLITGSEISLSRLVIDEQSRIWLPDYNNLEIEMTPLAKTLYFFFLKHPQGLMFHDLVEHKKELLSLYGRLSNSSNTNEIKKRIDDLVDMRSNSININCSRIKEAFVRKIENSIAKNYYITGNRRELKKVTLDNKLKYLQNITK